MNTKRIVAFALFFFYLGFVSVIGTLWESDFQDHYMWDGICIFEDYHFFWKYHTHIKGYLDQKPDFRSKDCQSMPNFHVLGTQGHPTFYSVILNAFGSDFELWELKGIGRYNYARGMMNVLRVTIVSWIAFIFLTFFILRDLYGERQAIVGSVLASIAPWLVKFADNDITVMAFFFLAIYCLIKASQTKRWIWYANYGIYAGFSLGLKFVSFALLPITLILHRDRKLLISAVLAAGLLALFSHPYSAIMELLDSSGVPVPGATGYLEGLSFYLIGPAIFITLLYYRKMSETDRFFLVWMWLFAFMPYMVYFDPKIQLRRATIVFPAIIALLSNKVPWPSAITSRLPFFA